MLKEKEDILRFINSRSNCHIGDIVNHFLGSGKDFIKSLSSYLVELKSDGYIDFPGITPNSDCWIKIQTSGKEYLEVRDREIANEVFAREQLLKRVEAAERSAIAAEENHKESRRIADAAEKRAATAEAEAKSAKNSGRITLLFSFLALFISALDLFINHGDVLLLKIQMFSAFLKSLFAL